MKAQQLVPRSLVSSQVLLLLGAVLSHSVHTHVDREDKADENLVEENDDGLDEVEGVPCEIRGECTMRLVRREHVPYRTY